MLGGWEARRRGGWEAGSWENRRLGGWESVRLGAWTEEGRGRCVKSSTLDAQGGRRITLTQPHHHPPTTQPALRGGGSCFLQSKPPKTKGSGLK